MNILFKNIDILTMDNTVGVIKQGYATVKNDKITYVGDFEPNGDFDEIIDGKGKVLMPGLVNSHGHTAMTLLRGYAENLPLNRWLTEKIFPVEERLDYQTIYAGSMLGIAELIAGGVTSFNDMYFFSESTVNSVIESGIKTNIGRSMTVFDEKADINNHKDFIEAKSLFEEYNGVANGRIIVDMALHSEYTTTRKFIEAVADYCGKVGAGVQLHLSETSFEHQDCKDRQGSTPAAYFAKTGVFDTGATAAHCVWVEDEDIDILREYGVTAAHNPTSNLKLGSGIADVTFMLKRGVRVALGTDGCASNNNLDMFEEMHLASLLPKGEFCDPTAMPPQTVLEMATINGSIGQGRRDTGVIKEGFKADITILDFNKPHLKPCYDIMSNIVYSAGAQDVWMTMVDGKILYKNGVYYTIDIEKVYAEVDKAILRVTDSLEQL